MAAYLLIGEAPTAGVATQIALRYKDCPHVHFIAALGTMLVGVWYVPEERRWWLEMVAEHPQVTLGLSRTAVYRTECPAYPAEMPPRSVSVDGPQAPCGSDCRACDRASADAGGCSGCPALAGGCVAG